VTHNPFSIWCALLIIVVVTVAVITDLRWRRIPNFLTFPAFAGAVVVRTFFDGWAGLGLAIAGALVAPVLLMLVRGLKKIGMGDLKLTMAIGAVLGPAMAVVMVLFSAIVGGILAIGMSLRPGGPLRELVSVLSIGLPFVKRKKKGDDAPVENRSSNETLPYGLAIGAGSLITLAVYWWTGNEYWFLSLVKITGSP
jgi:prepilin peptidase CpaA